MKIVPSLLSDSPDWFMAALRQAERFAEYVQVDIMDGKFVDAKSFEPEMINGISTMLPFELHLMVEEPLKALMTVRNPSLRKVIFHVEAAVKPSDFVERAVAVGLSAGLAVRPETTIEAFRDAARLVDTLLFLTVDPGRYGSPFKPEVMEKVTQTRAEFPDKIIAVDGGVSLDNLHVFYDAGVDYACIGSRIFLHGDPEQNYRTFYGKLKEMEGQRGRGQ